MGRGRSVRGGAPAPTQPGADVGAEPDHAAILAGVPALAGANLAMVSLVGSRAYGLADDTSDYDYRGAYVAPARALLGLGGPAEQLSATGPDPDVCCYEVGKFCALALAGNPTVLESLWARPVVESADGRRLRELRGAFLSERVRHTFLGSAASLMSRMLKDPIGPGDERRRARAIRHLFRYAEQGHQLLTGADMDIAVADPQHLRALERMDGVRLDAEWARMQKRIRTARSVLPQHPDRERVNDALVQIRLAGLGA